MGSPDPLRSTFHRACRDAGFRGTRVTTHRDEPLGVAVLNLQSSSWGRQRYLNVGLYVRALGDLDLPEERFCHYRIRADRLDAANRLHWLQQVLDRESPMTDAQRGDELVRLIRDIVDPFVRRIGTADGLRDVLASGSYPSAWVTGDLRAHLGLATAVGAARGREPRE